jgi:hypothetical protein
MATTTVETETASKANVSVRCLAPLREEFTTYAAGAEFETSRERATALSRMGLVAVVNLTDPPDRRPKLTIARERLHRADELATTTARELAEIQGEARAVEARVAACEGAMGVASGIEAVRVESEGLALAQRGLATSRTLLENVARRASAAAKVAQLTRAALTELEGRARWIKEEVIPKQQERLESCRCVYAEKQRDAEYFLTTRVRPAEGELQKLQAELAALGE